jgi:hypothetical protein
MEDVGIKIDCLETNAEYLKTEILKAERDIEILNRELKPLLVKQSALKQRKELLESDERQVISQKFDLRDRRRLASELQRKGYNPEIAYSMPKNKVVISHLKLGSIDTLKSIRKSQDKELMELLSAIPDESELARLRNEIVETEAKLNQIDNELTQQPQVSEQIER